LVRSKEYRMDKIIGILLLASAALSAYLSFFDSARVYVG